MEATRPGEGRFDAQRPNSNRGWSIRKRRRVLARDHHIPAHHASSEVGVPRVPPLMHIMKYMIPLVLVFVTTLKYQATPQSMLLENPAWMWCFIAATCVYWLIVGEIKQMVTTTRRGIGLRFRIYWGAALASGILSFVLVVTMLVRRPVSIWIPLTLIIITALLILFPAYTLLYRGFKCVVNKMRAVAAWARGLNLTRQPEALPV